MAKVYTASKTIERTDALPITINADGSALADYRIYGAAGGVGERTENLAWTGWAEDFVTRVASVSKAELEIIDGRNTVFFEANVGFNQYDTKYIFKTDWKENTIYTFSFEYFRQVSQSAASIISIEYTDGTLEPLPNYARGGWNKMTYSTAPKKTVKYLRAYYREGYINIDIDTFMVVEGSTAPSNYVPHGYKLPMSVSDGTASTVTPIYIGDTPLGEDEYVDYGEQKVYRMSEGVLTPTDPPVPLPALPTCDGTTIIDYDGTPKPSQMYVKYNSWSGWEPCTESVRRNGAWIDDLESIRHNGAWEQQT